MKDGLSLQEKHWPDARCFGCGPANEHGLHIRSFVEGEDVVAMWQPQPHHQAFPDVLNGGIIGTLLDCHSAAAAYWAFHQRGDEIDRAVTAEYAIKLLRPTPMSAPLRIVARAVAVEGRRARVEGRIEAGGEVTVTSEGTFVRPRPK